MDKRKAMRVEQDSFFTDIAAFKNACAKMNLTSMNTSQKFCNSSNKKSQIRGNKKLDQSIQSLKTTLEGGSFFEKEEKIHNFTQHYSEDRKETIKRLVQEAYVELKQFYVAQKQKEKQTEESEYEDEYNSLKIMLYNMDYPQEQQNSTTLTLEINQNSLNESEFNEFTKLSEDDELILILKFSIGKESNSIPWTVLPITEEQGYAYIQQNVQRLRNLYDSKLKMYMRNIIALYQYPNKTVVSLFLMLFQKLGMKFEIQYQLPDFMHQRVLKGMFGIQFHAVPYNFQGFSSSEYKYH